MKRALTAGIVTLALAVAGVAPSTAVADQNEQLQRFVAGAALLGLLGLALRERNRDDEPEMQQHQAPPRPHGWRREHDQLRYLPSACLNIYQVPRGRIELYDAGCLDARFPGARNLPLACAVTTRAQGRFISGFSAPCLTQRGYRMSDRY